MVIGSPGGKSTSPSVIAGVNALVERSPGCNFLNGWYC